MRAVAIALTAAALAACSSAASPSLPATTSSARLPQLVSPATPKDGIYVSEFSNSSLYGYAGENERNAPPICGETAGDFVADVATDRNGNLVAPSQQGELVYVYRGPKMCGPAAATLNDPYGLPVDVASADALTGKIAVANIEDDGPISNPPPGSVTICTVAAGCSINLTNPQMYRVGGVALDERGDCWASATNTEGAATLVVFARCSGKGHAASGFQNSGYGGLEFDKNGNLLALDGQAGRLFVYSGCRPACKLVAGPITLQGASYYGKLDSHGTTFAAADYQNGQIDIYTYQTTALTYEFSFDQDLLKSADVEGVAFSPGL
jgi:hypothetical protein